MRRRSCIWQWLLLLVVAAGLASASSSTSAPAEPPQNRKPSISLKATPPVGFSPLRVVITAELKGGANDFEDFYCASVEWDWGDGTKSETKADCDPYEAGKSEIKRRYVHEHTFRSSGVSTSPLSSSANPDMMGNQQPAVQYRVRFVLKQKNKTVGSGQTNVEVRGGMRDGGH
jgi:hypothetical protein